MSENIRKRMQDVQTISNLIDTKVADPKRKAKIKGDMKKLSYEQVRDKHNL